MSIKDNYEFILTEIENSRKVSITGEEVKLIAVSKMRTIDEMKEAYNLGIRDFGENKVQELKEKFLNFDDINFHMIGNLQTNKVKYIYDKVTLIQSLDRKSLLEEINKRADIKNIDVDCLVEINIAEESQKGGVPYTEALNFIETCIDYKNIKIKGIMTVAPDTSDKLFLRECFKKMFILKEKIIKLNYDEVEMKYLSMGMSGDYKIAIEEGSNMVRIGTSIFGKRNYK
ncbi:YggS family pyridoxal phosphate-dependent enzyme [Peptoniphilus sp. oral taxon 386]|uniref:YggS family pyridoxal phosphate-dependent enzyme n=1 Tax=Peptoniphilus sp. oral taxon 386 TaxID=652713 RepID=UPI0001DA9D54|nr:YggS family pyridoxal phosphate-dependent enzyme [Peptoniphilus sp. oral taxon 386]EFI42312.1 pyridoxal phosphate enzyme, YggS family [Peptoniphilus sp. oral taxon 386 str. F0131]